MAWRGVAWRGAARRRVAAGQTEGVGVAVLVARLGACSLQGLAVSLGLGRLALLALQAVITAVRDAGERRGPGKRSCGETGVVVVDSVVEPRCRTLSVKSLESFP